jgi:hypothetical protein
MVLNRNNVCIEDIRDFLIEIS